MKRFLSLALTVCLLLALSAPALASGGGIQKVNTYSGQFTDLPEKAWYTESVIIAYEYGLMTGASETKFNPDGTLSVAEAVTLASRLHDLYRGGTAQFSGGSPWYQPYVDYALENRIIGPETVNYSSPATRQEFALWMSRALPDSALPAINAIPDGQIPDVSKSPVDDAIAALVGAGVLEENYSLYLLASLMCNVEVDAAAAEAYDAIYRLYRAGVLTGNDSAGTYTPLADISRASVAAIVSRVVEPSTRKSVTLQAKAAELVPQKNLSNLSSLQKKASDAELAQAYEVAREIVTPLAGLSLEAQLCDIALALRVLTEEYIGYSMTDAHYNDPYGFFVLHTASCAGCTRATGLCLNMLGISYEHVNPDQYTHQWTRVNINGTYWICDAYGLYCGPEPAPYAHPNV